MTNAAPNLKARGIFGFSLPNLAFLFFFAVLLFRFRYDGDIFWHIATGNWILDHAAVPRVDIFSHSVSGTPWTAHEWLAALIFSLAYEIWHWPGIVVLAALGAALAYAQILAFLLDRLQPLYALPLTALAFFLSIHHFLARPHVLAMPLMVFWVARLVAASDGGKSPSLWIVPWMAVWANLHGSFTFGLALTAFFAFESIVRVASWAHWKRQFPGWGKFLLLSVAASLLTPYGVEGILFPTQLYGHPYLLDILTEWKSPDFHYPQALEFWILLAFGFSWGTGLRLPFLRSVLLLGLVHMSLHHIRHVALLGLLSPLILARPLAEQGAEKNLGRHGRGSFNALCEAFIRRPAFSYRIALLFLTVSLSAIPFLRDTHPEDRKGPFKAIEAVKQAGITGPVLNNPGFGGYLIFEGIPDFIDGRMDMYGEAFAREYIKAVNLIDTESLNRILEQYAIEWVFFDPGRPLLAYLESTGEWQRIYEDPYAVVLARCPGKCSPPQTVDEPDPIRMPDTFDSAPE